MIEPMYADALQHDERNVLDALENFRDALKQAKTVNEALVLHHRLDRLYHGLDALTGEALDIANALCVRM